MKCDMYRRGLGKVVTTGSMVMEVYGKLAHAVPASGGRYLFSDTDVGAQNLVLLGNEGDMADWLVNNKGRAIENQIKGQEDIYCAVTRYKPGHKYRVLDPVGEATKSIVEFVTGVGSGVTGSVTKASGLLKVFRELVSLPPAIVDLWKNFEFSFLKKQGYGENRGGPKVKGESTIWYIEITYNMAFEEVGFKKIANKRVMMSSLYMYLSHTYNLFI